ncbi:unnamed protein product, partial [Didymodactylos carnosus]
MWRTILFVSQANALNIAIQLVTELHDYITSQLVTYSLIQPSIQLQTLLEQTHVPSMASSIKIFDEFVSFTKTKPLFYRLLLHPGVTEEQLEEFMLPICQLAREIPNLELVIFFDEVNTSSCLGFFKEMFMDRTVHGKALPSNIFFTAAINPYIKEDANDGANDDSMLVHRQRYLVHELPQSLEYLKVSYGALPTNA